MSEIQTYNKLTPIGKNKPLGERLTSLVYDVLHLDWIFSKWYEKAIIVFTIFFTMISMFMYVRGLLI